LLLSRDGLCYDHNISRILRYNEASPVRKTQTAGGVRVSMRCVVS
jgi:hypothetical protein